MPDAPLVVSCSSLFLRAYMELLCVFLRNLPPILAEVCHLFSLKFATP